MIYKINKDTLLEEAVAFIAPAFVPGIQNDYAHALMDNVKNKKQLDAFKNSYSGMADYKTYDDTLHTAKRGLIYGAGTGAILGGVLAYEDPKDVSVGDAVGIGSIPAVLGGIGGTISGVIRNNISKEPKLYDRVKEKENLYK